MADNNLNTGTSVVDFLKSTGKDASFGSRAKLAVEQGIVKSTAQYTGSASQNTSLLGKLRSAGVAGNNPANIGSAGDATDFINAQQGNDIATAKQAGEPEVRNAASDLVNAFKDITGKNSLVPSVQMPDAPSFEATFQQLRTQYGVDALETTINDLDAQEQELQAQLRTSTNAEIGKPVALNVIQGRVGEQERNFMERIDFVQRQKARAVNEMKAANDTIENLMTFRKMDYDVAKESYNTEFSQNIQLFNTIKGAAEFSISEEERAADNARTNLQIIYNSIADSEDGLDSMDDTMKAKISKLELQAGLPQGFYENIATQKPESKILSTTTRESGGTKYADVIYKNADGSITTQQVRLGSVASGGSGKMTESELLRSARSEIASSLNGRTGQDGYVSPEDYKTARNAWVSKGFSAKDFDESFANEYANPDNYDQYGVSLF